VEDKINKARMAKAEKERRKEGKEVEKEKERI